MYPYPVSNLIASCSPPNDSLISSIHSTVELIRRQHPCNFNYMVHISSCTYNSLIGMDLLWPSFTSESESDMSLIRTASHIHTYTYTHIYIYTYTHIHIYTPIVVRLPSNENLIRGHISSFEVQIADPNR